MTKEEAQLLYRDIAAKAGDAWFKLDHARAHCQALESQLADLRSQKRDLETKLAGVSEDVVETQATAPV